MTVTHLNDCTCCQEHIACATPARPGTLVTRDTTKVTCKRCPGTVRYTRFVERARKLAFIAEHAPAVGSTWILNGDVTSTITEVTPAGLIRANAIDPTGYNRGDSWDIHSWEYGIRMGYILPAPEGTEPVREIRRFKTVRFPAHSLAAGQSEEVFKITGPGVHNRHHPHRIIAFTGKCCGVWIVHLHLSAEPVVIAPDHRPPVALDLAIGEVIEVDYSRYRVVPRRAADPLLVPLGWDPDAAPEFWKRS